MGPGMIPENRASSVPIPGRLLPPADRFRPDTTAYHIGGAGISDASQGLEVKVWVAQGYGDRIDVYPEGGIGSAETFVSGATNITFVALAFDQNMRPVIAYTDDGKTKLYWYDSTIQGYTTTEYPNASSPFCVMDDTRAIATKQGRNDVLFLYLDGGIKYRQQRDRYQTEYTLSTAITGRIARAGMSGKLRLQVELE